MTPIPRLQKVVVNVNVCIRQRTDLGRVHTMRFCQPDSDDPDSQKVVVNVNVCIRHAHRQDKEKSHSAPGEFVKIPVFLRLPARHLQNFCRIQGDDSSTSTARAV